MKPLKALATCAALTAAILLALLGAAVAQTTANLLTNPGNGDAQYVLAAYNSSQTAVSYQSTAKLTPAGLTYSTASYTVPAGVADVAFYAQIYESTETSVALFDDATLTISGGGSGGGTSGTTETMGETDILPNPDSGNANFVTVQKATLSQSGTLETLSLYTPTAAGSVILGVYDASGAGGGPGKLLAMTNSFTAVSGWNTANATSPATLAAGTYWLAYRPSSNALSFTKNSIGTSEWMNCSFGALPSTFGAVAGSGTSVWSFYATLNVAGGGGGGNTLLNYLAGLSSGETEHILSGQHSDYWVTNPMDNISALYSQTGQYPAILGTGYAAYGTETDSDLPEFGVSAGQNSVVTLTNQWLSQGGIGLVSWWPINPWTGGTQFDLTDINNFVDLLTPGTTAYTDWYAALDAFAAQAQQINGTVLFRPFLEVNGNWFWWGNQNPSQFIQFWQQTHNYLVNTKGVKNLLWVYNVATGWGNYTTYYPGSNYVDVVSIDSYPPTTADASAYNALVPLGKPIIYAEMGAESAHQVAIDSGNYDSLLQLIKTNFPKVVAVVVWCQNWSMSDQLGAPQFMSDPAIINRTKLPSGLR